MRIRELGPRSLAATDLVEAVARARGCRTPQETALFLDPDPPVPNPLPGLPPWADARDRVARALASSERVLLFGDYDCDGITALVQMHRFFRAAGHGPLSWFVPDRNLHDYGLSARAVEACLAQGRPDLLIALDCGSAAPDSVRRLQACGVDTIVVDHHAVPSSEAHPATAHLNPKAFLKTRGQKEQQNGQHGRHGQNGQNSENSQNGHYSQNGSKPAETLASLSASGLAFLFCDALAGALGITAWRRDASLLLAGLGTLVDVMPLHGLNRSLVKSALRLANDPAGLALVPGLHALASVSGGGAIDARTFGFRWGPRLNASGRLEGAADPVRLLLSERLEEALPFAEACHRANTERRELQSDIEAAALEMAEARTAVDPPGSVLLLCGRDWHAGIVGIVASRIRERHLRPAIVCGWHEEGYWKGSGRSMDCFDLGSAVQAAVEAGVLMGGGGHRLAAGLKLAGGKEEEFRTWLLEHCRIDPAELEPVYEVLAPIDALPAGDGKELGRAWCGLFDCLEPFGSGNPRPHLIHRGAELRWGPKAKMRSDGSGPWAFSAGFTWRGRGYLFADWTDLERAGAEWKLGGRYDLVLAVGRREGRDRRTGAPAVYYDLKVADCAPAG